MANREYSREERDELLSALKEAFEECYKNSEDKYLSLDKSNDELKSNFFKRLDIDSNVDNVEQNFTISRSTMELFFLHKTKSIFSDQNSIKINALIKFYDKNVFDPETKEFKPKTKKDEELTSKDSKNDELHSKSNNSILSIKADSISIFTNKINVKKENESHPKLFDWNRGIEILIITLLSIFSFLYLLSGNDKKKEYPKVVSLPITARESEEKSVCHFEDTNVSEYKILIVPFKSMITSNKVKKDIGAFIEERLDKLNNEDSLNLSIYYCTDFKNDKKSGDGDDLDYYRRVMKESGADHIIYGASQDVDTISKLDLTKIRINYYTDIDRSIAGKLKYDNKSDYNLVALSNIFKGELMENIEYIIYWNAALSMSKKRNYKKTLKYLNKIPLNPDSDNYKLELFKVMNLYNVKKFDSARNKINSIITHLDDKERLAQAYYLRGSIKFVTRDPTRTDDIKKVIDLGVENYAVYYNLALDLYENGKNDEAIKYFNLSLELCTDDKERADILNTKGMLFSSIGKPNEALSLTEESIRIAPEIHVYWANKATILLDLGLFNKALKAVNKSISLNSNYHLAYHTRAGIFVSTGQFDAAIIDFKKSIKILPIENPSYGFLLKTLIYREDYEQALEVVNQALKNLKSSRRALLNYRILIYKNLGCDYEAMQDEKLLESNSPNI